jgi:hypothetical protein
VSYFEPSRRPFARRQIGSWTRLLDWLWRRTGWQRGLAPLLLAAYVAAASWLCGAGMAAGFWTGALAAVSLTALVIIEHLERPALSRVARALIIAIGTAALLVPAIVFVALGFWLLISLPLWLYRG